MKKFFLLTDCRAESQALFKDIGPKLGILHCIGCIQGQFEKNMETSYIGTMEKKMETTRSTGHRTPWRFLRFSIRRTSCFPHACQCFVHCAEITLENRRIEAYR